MREFLKGLELDKEIIDSIMAEHGKHLTTLKEQIKDYKSQISERDDEIISLNKTIDDNKKSLENLETLTNENTNLKSQLQLKDNQMIINNSNVKKEFSEFVTSKVMANVNDETDFTKALESYKKENPQYFGDTVVKKVQSGPTLNGGGTQPQTTNDIMNNILRGATNNAE